MVTDVALAMSMIVFSSIICQWLAWKSKLPPILFLLLCGILLGPVLGLLEPTSLFGNLLFPGVSLAVAIILFEGSLTLQFRELHGIQSVVQYMVTIGALVHFIVVSVASVLILDLSWKIAFVFSAITVVTGPTVIVPLLRTVRPNAKISNVLRWEGIVIDPLGALLVVMVYEFMVSGGQSDAMNHSLLVFLKLIAVGGILGAAGGYILGVLLRRHWLPEYLHNLATLGWVVSIFSLSNHIEHESGLLAVTIMGIWLANMPRVRVEEILNFKENLSIMFISALFIVLAARVNLTELAALSWPIIVVLLVIQFISRPLGVFFSTFNSTLNWKDKALLAWIAPRGIVAAAISALFSIKLEEQGVENAEMLVPLTFSVIIGTVVWQSFTARPLARWLGVAEPEPRGFLIVGANSFARKLAKSLQEWNYRTLLVDTNWEYIRAARMEGLETFYGNPISAYADRKLDLVGIGYLLALSPQRDLNVLATWKYRHEFGRENIFSLQALEDVNSSEKHQVSDEQKGQMLFGEGATYTSLVRMINTDYQMKVTRITENFKYSDFLNLNPDAVPLLAMNEQGKLVFVVRSKEFIAQPGWSLLSLTTPNAPKEKDTSKDSGGTSNA
ncbi:MAG: sodium:proton antiporter [Pseudomonadota bacterium]|nr:sodium:proton antiporter [Pseudomonadota bacterium]|tara:strand:+ start:20828 stop:22669 length:1842 start_codon:yes stop_codon:yes gene_type:complete